MQFTHDSFNQEGELTESGFGSTVGAIGSEVSFVFGGDLIDEDSFDAAAYYPNVDKVDIAQKCLAIVVKKPEQLEQVKKMVEAQQINVPVYLASEYDPKSSPKDLDIRKKRALVEHANTRNQAEIQAQTEQLENPEVEEAEVEEPEVVEGEEAAGFPAESAEQPLTAEFLTESELGAVARAVDGTDMDARALMAICQGSRSAFEKSGIIYTSLKDMLEKTLARNAESRTAQNYGEEQTRQTVYMDTMKRDYANSLTAINDLRKASLTLPGAIRNQMIFHIQHIENNLHMAMQIINRPNNPAKIDRAPNIPAEKRASDNAELTEISEQMRYEQ